MRARCLCAWGVNLSICSTIYRRENKSDDIAAQPLSALLLKTWIPNIRLTTIEIILSQTAKMKWQNKLLISKKVVLPKMKRKQIWCHSIRRIGIWACGTGFSSKKKFNVIPQVNSPFVHFTVELSSFHKHPKSPFPCLEFVCFYSLRLSSSRNCFIYHVKRYNFSI